MSKAVDLKCEETLRDSPPPRSAVPQTTVTQTSSTPNAESSTFSVYVRKFEPHSSAEQRNSPSNRPSETFASTNVVGSSSPLKAAKLESPKPQYSVSPFIQPNVFYAPVTKLLQQHSVISSMFSGGGYPFEQSSYHQALIKNVSPIKLSTSDICDQQPVVSGNLSRDSSALLTGSSKQQHLPKVISLPSVVQRTQPPKSSTTVTDTQAASGKPVTLHINTGKGTTVVQLQQSTAVSPSSKPIPVTPKRNVGGATESQQISSRSSFVVAPTSAAISSLQNLPSRIFPSPISLPPTAAAAAYLYQDPMSAYHTLASLHSMNTKLNAAPISIPQPSTLPFVVGGVGTGRTVLPNISDSSILSHARIVGSPIKPHSSPGTFSSSPTSTHNNGAAPGSAVAGTPGQSPRPSILRKRPSELAGNGSSTSAAVATPSSVVKKLTYETLINTTPRKGEIPPTTAGLSAIDEVVISTSRRAPEHPDAGNSNHSSSASTVSAGSAVDGHSNSSYPETTGTIRSLSPSPRKRPRKQRLDDLPEGGGDLDSEDERLSTETLTATEQHGGGEFGVDVKPNVHSEDYFVGVDFVEPLKSRPVKIELVDNNMSSSKVTPKPRPSLWSTCETAWQPRRNHFLQYDDVKPKEEKKPTAAELCNQKQIWQKIEGWRLQMISLHVDDLDKCEQTNLDDLDVILRAFDAQQFSPVVEDGLERGEVESLREMVLTSVQRCKAVREQLAEMKKPLHNILKHKRIVETMVQKYSAKRPSRKKEKTDL